MGLYELSTDSQTRWKRSVVYLSTPAQERWRSRSVEWKCQGEESLYETPLVVILAVG